MAVTDKVVFQSGRLLPVQVKQEFNSIVAESNLGGGVDSASYVEERTSQTVDVTLQGVEIVEHWLDEEDGEAVSKEGPR